MSWYWHIHHNVLAEQATEPIEARIAYIREKKPANEIETRLRLLKPVESGKALAAMQRIGTALAEYEKAQGAAWAEYGEVQGAAWAEVEEEHRKECPDCPWDSEKGTIFPAAGDEA